MRKTFLMLTVLMLTLAGIAGDSLADGLILPDFTSLDYLVVRYHHVTVTIEDNHAISHVEQEFFNPQPYPVRGRYLFPVPPEAMLSVFEATVDGAAQAITYQDATTTNAALFDQVANRRDPSLLQYADWESLAFDLDLPAGGSRRMTLEYDEVLVPSGGLFHYRYILSTERYSALPLESVSIVINLHLTEGLASLYSSSHLITTEYLGADETHIRWEAENVLPTDDFDLFFAPSSGGFGAGLLTGQRADQNHFLFMFTPEIALSANTVLPKDIVLVVDRSESMMGEKISQARNALYFILGQLNPNDRFSIVGFDDDILVQSTVLQPVNAESRDEARRFVDRLNADGGTNIEAALQTGLTILERSEQRSGAPRIVIFLTDGLPTAGVTDDGVIAQLVGRTNDEVDANLHVFGVGYDVNSHLLDRLAGENGGSVTYVQPGENLETRLADFYGRIAAPVLTDVEIDFDGIEVADLYPQTLPDLFQGSSLLLTGRYNSDSEDVTVRVSGWAGAEHREYTYGFDLSTGNDHDFVPRLWATRRIGDLLDRVRVEGETAALIEEIRALGLGYGLITPYTTFIIEAQADGVASAANMALYGDQTALNQNTGQTTIQARVQNQAYQQTGQANLAIGANVINSGQSSLAQVAQQNIDLTLLQDLDLSDVLITDSWIEANIAVDRTIVFASDAYFELALDPALRTYLQSGTNVIFNYNGEVIAVQDN